MCQAHPSIAAPPLPSRAGKRKANGNDHQRHDTTDVARGAILWQLATVAVSGIAVGHSLGENLLFALVVRTLGLLAAIVLGPAACAAVRRALPAATASARAQPARSDEKRALARPSLPAESAAQACVTVIHGRTYDLSAFVQQHPGGPTAILLAHGTDATAMFESYHPFTRLPRAVLAKYETAGAATPAEASRPVGEVARAAQC